ncbi:hypothetical protein AR505_0876 [methanogenic archaeon ISO4-H5]|nr:hypothetical protein AR505_0876 [methanogenic archaeon ISO4-H5]
MTINESEEDKNVLRQLLLDTDSLDKLETFADNVNIFRILSIENNEIRHSNFLAWLLDPAGNHKLGDIFLKKFLFEYASSAGLEKIDVFDIDNMDFDDAIVHRELHHMDIIIESEKAAFVLVIENKIRSKESPGQTSDYRVTVNELYSQVKKKFFVYLTLDQSEAIDKEWVPIGYPQIIRILDSITGRIPKDSPGLNYITDYTEMLKEMLGDEETEIQKLCSDIYARHKKAIDLLIENIPDSFHKRAELIKRILKDLPGVIIKKSNNSYIRFTTPLILEKVGGLGTSDWFDKCDDVLLFEIINNRQGNSAFTLTLGPAIDPEKRQIIYDHLSNNLKNRAQSTGMYSRVFSESFKINDDKDIENQLKKKITEFVTVTIPKKINPVIEGLPVLKEKM